MPNAVGLAARILEELAAGVSVVELVPGRGGIYDVHVGGELVFTKCRCSAASPAAQTRGGLIHEYKTAA